MNKKRALNRADVQKRKINCTRTMLLRRRTGSCCPTAKEAWPRGKAAASPSFCSSLSFSTGQCNRSSCLCMTKRMWWWASETRTLKRIRRTVIISLTRLGSLRMTATTSRLKTQRMAYSSRTTKAGASKKMWRASILSPCPCENAPRPSWTLMMKRLILIVNFLSRTKTASATSPSTTGSSSAWTWTICRCRATTIRRRRVPSSYSLRNVVLKMTISRMCSARVTMRSSNGSPASSS